MVRWVRRVVLEARVKAVALQVGLVDDVQPQRRAQLVPLFGFFSVGGGWCVCVGVCVGVMKFAQRAQHITSQHTQQNTSAKQNALSPARVVRVVARAHGVDIGRLHQPDVAQHVGLAHDLAFFVVLVFLCVFKCVRGGCRAYSKRSSAKQHEHTSSTNHHHHTPLTPALVPLVAVDAAQHQRDAVVQQPPARDARRPEAQLIVFLFCFRGDGFSWR